jgi:tRNA modification GTPase
MLGARPARGGEFTRRALLNGKLDLAQAEAVADLIDAASEPMRRIALGAVGGGLSRQVGELRSAILQLEALMAYSVDFPEEDDGTIPAERTLGIAREVANRISNLLDTAGRGAIIRDGALIVLAGPPNVGKSSLFNALLGQDRAIVTEIAGTTRDAIEHPCLIGDWPVRLIDTAGLRSSSDIVERLGIEVSEKYLKDADLALVCSDGSGGSRSEMEATVRKLGARETLFVETKSDLRERELSNSDALSVSATAGTGLNELRAAIAQVLDTRYGRVDYESPVITHTRHADALRQAGGEIALFIDAMERNTTPAIAAVHLRAGVSALEEIIGAVSVDDLLDEVFSRFCIGK